MVQFQPGLRTRQMLQQQLPQLKRTPQSRLEAPTPTLRPTRRRALVTIRRKKARLSPPVEMLLPTRRMMLPLRRNQKRNPHPNLGHQFRPILSAKLASICMGKEPLRTANADCGFCGQLQIPEIPRRWWRWARCTLPGYVHQGICRPRIAGLPLLSAKNLITNQSRQICRSCGAR